MTPRAQKVLDAIKSLTVDGVPPSYRQIQARTGYKSVGNIHEAIHQLEAEGVVEMVPGRARTLKIIEGSTRDQMVRWSSAELKRVRDDAYAILDARLDEPAGAGLRRVSA